MAKNRLVLIAYCTKNQAELVEEAEKRNLSVEVLVTEKELFNRIKAHDAKYLVGVSCPEKIALISPLLEEKGISYRAISANAGGGCFKQSGVQRAVDMNQYIEALDWLASQPN